MDIAHEEVWIRERAYWLWEEEGRPQGREFDHWVRARSEIAGGDNVPAAKPEFIGALAKEPAPRKGANSRTRKTLQ